MITYNCNICGCILNNNEFNSPSEIDGYEIEVVDRYNEEKMVFGVKINFSCNFNTTNKHWCKNCLRIAVRKYFIN